MSRYRQRPLVERPERPVDMASEAQIAAMNAKLKARIRANVDAESYSSASASDGESRRLPEATPSAGGGGQPGSAQALPSDPRPALNWIHGADKWTRVTTDGRYRINISVTEPAGVAREAIYGYAAWKVCPDCDFALGSFLSGSEARLACQRFEDGNAESES